MAKAGKGVFISYRRTNFPWAMLIYQSLTSRGFDVFLDYESIDAGAFEQIINENIIGRDHFLVILSQSALDNKNRSVDWLKKEIEIALEHKRNIVPIILEGFDFSSQEAIKYFTKKVAVLKEYQGIRLFADFYEEGLEKLANRYLNKPLDSILHPVSLKVKQEVLRQQATLAKEPKVKRKELSAQEWFERGYKTKKLRKQIRFYTKAIDLDSKFYYAYNNRGNCYTLLGKYKKGLADFNKAIKLNPNIADAYSNRGNAYDELGKYKKALRDYDKAIKLNPEYGEAYYNRGTTYGKHGKYKKALADFNKAIKLNPENAADVYSNRGLAYHIQGKYKKALRDYDEAIKLNPEDAGTYSNRGDIYFALEEYEKAFRDYGEANKLNPNSADV